jgi:GTP-binding protein EngB required for normal cell division
MAEVFGMERTDQKFKTPEEELAYLRGEVARHEKTIAERGEAVNKEEVISRQIETHAERSPEETLHKDFALKREEVQSIVLDLAPEKHDKKIEELIGILQDKGILNTLSIVEKLKDPHVQDDFHRFLIQYIKAGFLAFGQKENNPIFKALKMTLFEISLPGSADETQKNKNLKELISKMEQFYSGMLSIGTDQAGAGYFSLELANARGTKEIIFYISIPDLKKSLFEKQIQSIFPDAHIVEKKDDYNIFNENGDYVASYAELGSNNIFPIKSYEQYDYDPLNVLLNSFSKIDKEGEGASIQIIVKPESGEKTAFYKRVLKEMEKGANFKDALNKADTSFFNLFKKAGKEIVSPAKKEDKKDASGATNQTPIENIKAKISSPLTNINLRILTSAATREEANAILLDIESSFNQFENTTGNKFKFKRVEGNDLLKIVRDFSFRIFDEKNSLILNLKELTTVMHLPEVNFSQTAGLKLTKANTAPAPLDLPETGILLGTNKYRNTETPIHISAEDRLRHFYVIGQTGTGKTTLLKTMIRQDILAGEGVCMIDPHGSDIQEVLSFIPPERYDDVIYFDPSYTERPMGLNMLEYDTRFPEQKTFVVNEMLSIFNKLFDMKTAGGPMFEQYFRNAVMLTIEDPSSGSTLLDVSRVLADKTYREMKLSKCKNPLVIQFWREIAGKAGGEASLANIVPYITSKFDVFLSNEIMRPIVSQEKSAFDFRDIMDNKKILLVNLAKGRLGDINSNLIGLIIVGKILMAALSRTDSFGKDFPPFYLYIDEFQNVTTDSISTILSEARKYKLALTIAHQFIAQLEEKIKNSVFGNVGSMSVFRVSSEDAEYLEKQFAPVFTAKDLMNIDNHNSYVKMLANGRPVKPFSMETNMPPRGTKILLDKVKQQSYLKYGKDRASVEAEILAKYKKPEIPA